MAAISGTDVIFTPAADFNGAASFTYTLQDNGTTNGVADPLTALSLAALDITDELFRSREDKRTDEDDVGARLGALVALLDKVAPRDSGSDR